MHTLKLSLLAVLGFTGLAFAPASAMPVNDLSQAVQTDVQDARIATIAGVATGLGIAIDTGRIAAPVPTAMLPVTADTDTADTDMADRASESASASALATTDTGPI